MQEDMGHDAQTLSVSERAHWYTRLWSFCLGYGCLDDQMQECPVYLLRYDPVGRFQRAASMGDVSAVEHFITFLGYHVDKYDRRNRTSLHYACVYNHPDVVTLLIKHSCNINVQDDEGCTPLIKAIEQNNPECVSILLKHGADPHMTDFSGNTALHYAVYSGNRAIAGELLEHQVDINAKTKHGFTPFSLAVFEKKQQMAEFLKEKGANVHAVVEPDSEALLGEESKSMFKMSTQINTEVDDGTEHTSLSSEGASSKEAEQRTKEHIRFNKEVHYSSDPKPFCSEVRPPGQLKSILKKSVQISTVVNGRTKLKTSPSEGIPLKRLKSIFKKPVQIIEADDCKKEKSSSTEAIPEKESKPTTEESSQGIAEGADSTKKISSPCEVIPEESKQSTAEVDSNAKQKPLSRLSDKPDLDVPGPAVDDSDSGSVTKNTSQYLHQSKMARRGLKKRVQKLFGRSEVNVCFQREPLCSTSGGQTPLKNVSSDTAMKILDRESVSPGLLPEDRSVKILMEQNYAQGDNTITKERTKTVCGLSGKTEVNDGLVEEPLPSTSEEKTHGTPPSEDSDEETWVQLVATQCSFLNQNLRERLKERTKEGTESSESDASDEEPLSSISGGGTHLMQRMSPKPETRNKYDREYRFTQSEHLSANKTEEERARLSVPQYAHLNQHFKQDLKEKVCETYEKPDSNICSNKEPIPDKPEQRTHLKKLTKEKKKHDINDAYVHSRYPLVKRQEHMNKHADWHHAQLKELLRNDVKEMLKEQMAAEHARLRELLRNDVKKIVREQMSVEHARLRELLRNDAKEIQDLLRNELEQTCLEQVALLQDQMEETQQKQGLLQLLQLKDLFRRDLKEMVHEQIKNSKIIVCPKGETLPGACKGTLDLQRTSLEQEMKKKYEGDHDHAPPHSGEPSVQAGEEVTDRQSESHCVPLKELIQEGLKEDCCEMFEKNKIDICLETELSHIPKGRKQLRPSVKTDELTMGEPRALQYKRLKEHIRKDLKEMVQRQLENSEVIIYPREEPLPDDSRSSICMKGEEKKPRCLYLPHFSSFKHRIAALRATAHTEPAPAASSGDAGGEDATDDVGGMGGADVAQRAELALALSLAARTQHPRVRPHADPEPAPGHHTGDTTDSAHSPYLAIDSCLLAQVKSDKLSTDPESAPLYGSSDDEDC